MQSQLQLLPSGKCFTLYFNQISIAVVFSSLFLVFLGNIRNTERLNYDKQKSYKIIVTAFDCGQKRAKKDVAVHIDVKPVCKPGWQGQK